jgi:hypothetical protein
MSGRGKVPRRAAAAFCSALAVLFLCVAALLLSRSESGVAAALLPPLLRAPAPAPAPRWLPAAPPAVDLSRVIFVVNTVLDAGRAERNYRRVYGAWARGLSRAPRVLWFSDGERAAAPRVRRVAVADWQERWAAQVAAAWAAAGEADEGGPAARAAADWFFICDDDTYVFVDSLLAALGAHDPRQLVYLGAPSEDGAIASALTRMGMGGGGVALSAPLVRALAAADGSGPQALAPCLARYAAARGVGFGDMKLSLCVADAGARFTREDGLHQFDLRGDLTGPLLHLAAAQPLLSLHHMYTGAPVLASSPDVLDAMDAVMAAYAAHARGGALAAPGDFLSLQFAHLRSRRRTAVLNIGLVLRLIGGPPVPASHLIKLVPATATAWDAAADAGMTFDTRPADDPCSVARYEWAAAVPAGGQHPDARAVARAAHDARLGAADVTSAHVYARAPPAAGCGAGGDDGLPGRVLVLYQRCARGAGVDAPELRLLDDGGGGGGGDDAWVMRAAACRAGRLHVDYPIEW